MIKKYSKEFKLQVVKFYDEHPELGYLSVSREFKIPSDETVRNWVKLYQAHGEAGLEKSRMNPARVLNDPPGLILKQHRKESLI